MSNDPITPTRLREAADERLSDGKAADAITLLREADRLEQAALWSKPAEVFRGRNVPGQAKRLRVQKQFEKILEQNVDALPWGRDYVEYIRRGYSFREAALIGWSKYPPEERIPRTQGEMAKLLGCSEKTIYTTLNKPQVQAAIQIQDLGPWTAQLHRIDHVVIPRLVMVAENPDNEKWEYAVSTVLKASGRAGPETPLVNVNAQAGIQQQNVTTPNGDRISRISTILRVAATRRIGAVAE